MVKISPERGELHLGILIPQDLGLKLCDTTMGSARSDESECSETEEYWEGEKSNDAS